MSEQALAITIDGRTVLALPRPEDEPQLAQVLAGRSAIALTGTDDDLEGHAISDAVTVDVEGHALTLRLPNAGDAVALRRALAVGAVTATIATAGVIAALQGPSQGQIQAPAAPAAHSQAVPAQAARALEAAMARDASFDGAAQSVSVPVRSSDRSGSNVPAPAIRAGEYTTARDESFGGSGSRAATPAEASDQGVEVPAPAVRALESELDRP